MYRLYYEVTTKRYFVEDETDVKTRLLMLKRRLTTPGGSFTFTEYLEALGLKPNIPRNMNRRYKRKDFKYMNVFSLGGGYIYGAPVILVNICSQK